MSQLDSEDEDDVGDISLLQLYQKEQTREQKSTLKEKVKVEEKSEPLPPPEEWDDNNLEEMMNVLFPTEEERVELDKMNDLDREMLIYEKYEEADKRRKDATERYRSQRAQRAVVDLDVDEEDEEEGVVPMEEDDAEYRDEEESDEERVESDDEEDYELYGKSLAQIMEEDERRIEEEDDNREAKFEKVLPLVLKRDKLLEWIDRPFFFDKSEVTENGQKWTRKSILVNHYVKYRWDNSVHSFGIITEVTQDKKYVIPNTQISTTAMIHVSNGESDACLRVSNVSNQSVEEDEFVAFIQRTRNSRLFPSQMKIDRKLKEKDGRLKRYFASEQRVSQTTFTGKNLTRELNHLRELRQKAVQEGRTEKVKEYNMKIQELQHLKELEHQKKRNDAEPAKRADEKMNKWAKKRAKTQNEMWRREMRRSRLNDSRKKPRENPGEYMAKEHNFELDINLTIYKDRDEPV